MTKLKSLSTKTVHTIENSAILITLFFIVLFPALDMLAQKKFFLDRGITGIENSSEYLRHLMLWFAMVGAMISSREGHHISLAVFDKMIPEKFQHWSHFFVGTVGATVLMSFAFASYDNFMLVSAGETVGKFPQLLFTSAFIVGFFVMAVREAKCDRVWMTTVALIISVLVPLFFFGAPTLFWEWMLDTAFDKELFFADKLDQFIMWAGDVRWEYPKWIYVAMIVILLVATALGTPIFVVLSGIAGVLFFQSEQMLNYIPDQAYQILKNEIYPTIPLFTVAGFILSESKSGERLVAFFKALFGWIPGGLAIMAILVSAFFTTFTGASGVTILALGGLLHYILTREGYKEDFTEGYLTASGSIGLLFPPSLPIILYGVQAQVSIKELFAGGIVPGVLFIVALSVYAVLRGAPKRTGSKETFDFKEVVRTFKAAAPEIMLPVTIIVLFFTGQATLLQTAVIAVIYMTITSLLIHRDIEFKSFHKVLLKATPIAGSVLIIVAASQGLSAYIVDAQIPQQLTEWMTEWLDPSNPTSKIIFLLLLNVALLITGFFMDIFSAIIVVVPLILPIGEVFGIGPVHLGIVFLANLELGYLTPPVGLNLFLAALRFEKPLVKIYKSVLPFLAILIVTVLVITYVPQVTYSGLHLFNFTTEQSDTTIVRSDALESFITMDTMFVNSLGEIVTTVETHRVEDSLLITTKKIIDRQTYKTISDTLLRDTVVEFSTTIDTIYSEIELTTEEDQVIPTE